MAFNHVVVEKSRGCGFDHAYMVIYPLFYFYTFSQKRKEKKKSVKGKKEKKKINGLVCVCLL